MENAFVRRDAPSDPMPVEGIEPTLPYQGKRILNPPRLPVPPHRRGVRGDCIRGLKLGQIREFPASYRRFEGGRSGGRGVHQSP